MIWEPKARLKFLQKSLNSLLQEVRLPPYIMGGRKGRSIKLNAKPHIRKPMVSTYDIRKFFDSVRMERVHDTLLSLGCSEDVAAVITRLTTLNYALPQGAPSSPILAVLVFLPSARRLYGLAKSMGASYTVYIDDSAFSGKKEIEGAEGLILEIFIQGGFRLNPKKIKHMRHTEEQVVTGIAVNRERDITRKFLAAFDAELECLKQDVPGKSMKRRVARLEGWIGFAKHINRRRGKQMAKALAVVPQGN